MFDISDYYNEALEVEIVPLARCSSQLQLSSGLGMLVSQSVYNAKVTENCSKDFADFWSEVRYRYSEKSDEALFSKKNFLNDPGKKNCIFRWFLDHFSKTTVTILLKSSEMVDNIVRNNP